MTSVKDFIFDWDAEAALHKGTQSVEDMKAVFQQIAAAGKVTEKERKEKELRRKHKPSRLTK